MDVAHSFSACSSSSQASLGMHPSVSSVLPDSLVLLEYVKQEPPSDTESTDRSLGCHQTSSGSHMQTSVHNGYSVFEHASGKHRKNRVARRPCCSEPDTARSWSHSQTSSQRQVPSATCFVLPCININITNGNFIVNVNSPRFNVPTHNHSGRNNSPTDEQDARTSKSCDECCPTARDYAERAQSPSHTSQQSSYGCRDRRFSHCHSPCNCVRHR
ncbi:uncharacterized protein LOC144099156 isoform X4 [Amblyomma americanum]